MSGVVIEIPKGDIRIYAGDFNAKMGSNSTDLERIMGPQGLGEMSGELFTEFCGNQHMVIGGDRSFLMHKVTWVSRDGRTDNQIDHISVSHKWRGSLVVGKIRLARVVPQEEKVV